ncbi:hypothetical protein HNO88_003647 [Novosphingobium chloroacetimidivorans]|uniref:Uncharacterized protein n=1 Tax=Novosphingobium chloroacetimidivorans TaxID=1428314 RepID=A0A7W7KDK0_9SPHN|nr:hypothetical protein [Novosphingobium chloroacetimidivorans]MBB4860304.1 hypothetical protein [Novosphingobium chloroacetimidivorans]
MTAKIFDSNKGELMAIAELEREGNDLVIRGKIYGAMPMTARLRPEEVRHLLKLLSPRILLFLLTMPFRGSQTKG